MADQSDDDVIVRTWSATATASGAAKYRQYFAETLLPTLREVDGFMGCYLLGRELDSEEGSVEVTVHTFWRSTAAVQAFAGQDVTVAIVEPEARSFLATIDDNVTHRVLWIDDQVLTP